MRREVLLGAVACCVVFGSAVAGDFDTQGIKLDMAAGDARALAVNQSYTVKDLKNAAGETIGFIGSKPKQAIVVWIALDKVGFIQNEEHFGQDAQPTPTSIIDALQRKYGSPARQIGGPSQPNQRVWLTYQADYYFDRGNSPINNLSSPAARQYDRCFNQLETLNPMGGSSGVSLGDDLNFGLYQPSKLFPGCYKSIRVNVYPSPSDMALVRYYSVELMDNDLLLQAAKERQEQQEKKQSETSKPAVNVSPHL